MVMHVSHADVRDRYAYGERDRDLRPLLPRCRHVGYPGCTRTHRRRMGPPFGGLSPRGNQSGERWRRGIVAGKVRSAEDGGGGSCSNRFPARRRWKDAKFCVPVFQEQLGQQEERVPPQRGSLWSELTRVVLTRGLTRAPSLVGNEFWGNELGISTLLVFVTREVVDRTNNVWLVVRLIYRYHRVFGDGEVS